MMSFNLPMIVRTTLTATGRLATLFAIQEGTCGQCMGD